MSRFSRVFTNNFFKATSIVFLGSMLVNVFNYVFSLLMGRLLEPSLFGEVNTLFSLLLIVSVPSTSLITYMARSASEHKARSQQALFTSLYKKSASNFFLLGVLLSLVYWLLTPFLKSYLQIDLLPLLIFGLFLPTTLVSALNIGTLQGFQNFFSFAFVNLISTVVKLMLGVLFVLLGFGVNGVVGALVCGSLASFLFGFIQVKKVLSSFDTTHIPEIKFRAVVKRVSGRAFITFLSVFLLAVFNNIDVILAKHYLTSDVAGQYSALTVIGKIVSYGSLALVSVMLPLVSGSHASKDGKSKRWLLLSLFVSLFIALPILGLFYFFPSFVISIILGTKYLIIARYLGWYGLEATLSTFALIFINYYLGTNSRLFLLPLTLGVLGQVVLILIYHSSIWQLIGDLNLGASFVLGSMLLVFLFEDKIINWHENNNLHHRPRQQ